MRDVVFPHMMVPLSIVHERSFRAVEEVMKDDRQILLVAQKNASQDDPSPEDIFSIGTISTVLQLLKLPDWRGKVLVQGERRARIQSFTDRQAFFEASAVIVPDRGDERQELEALARSVIGQFEQYVKLSEEIPPKALVSIHKIKDPGELADIVASHLTLKVADRQELLEMDSVPHRLERVSSYMEAEIGVLLGGRGIH